MRGSFPLTLRSFLENPSRPPGTLTYHELQGFLFTVASAPELVRPSEWMPMVFGDRAAEYASLEEARAIVGELMNLYNAVNGAVFENRATLPEDCAFRMDLLANLEDDAPVAQWSRGFLRGHQWLEESWDAYLPKALDDEYAAMLMTLSFFASKDLASAYCKESGAKNLAEMAAAMHHVFPMAIADYARLGRSIQQVIAESRASGASEPRGRKVGRNERCPCGSGRKYKKCCGDAAPQH